MAENVTTKNDERRNAPSAQNARALSGWNIAFGIWLIISPFILAFSVLASAVQNNITMGIIVLLLAIIGTSMAGARWSRVINIIAGIWVFISPFVLGLAFAGTYAGVASTWNNLILGALIIIFESTALGAAAKFHQTHRTAYQ